MDYLIGLVAIVSAIVEVPGIEPATSWLLVRAHSLIT